MPKTDHTLYTQVIGNIGKEIKFTEGGNPRANFSVAGKRSVPKERRDGGEIPCPRGWTQSFNGKNWETTVWFNVVAWGSDAIYMRDWFEGGQQIWLRGIPSGESTVTEHGSVQNPRVWTGNDGVARANYEIILTEIIGGGLPKSERRSNGDGQFAPPPEAVFDNSIDVPDQLPF